MLLASLTTAALMAQAATMGGHGLFAKHKGARPIVVETVAVAECDTCGVESAKVARLVARLKTCPRWQDRDDAAHDLRKIKARCHPEAVAALSFAMLHDCHEEVREEAAESLADLAPCDPFAREALAIAAERDPDHATRKQARKALARMGKRCAPGCDTCDPGLSIVSGPQPDPVLIAPYEEAAPLELEPRTYIQPAPYDLNPQLAPYPETPDVAPPLDDVPPPAPEALPPFNPGARRPTPDIRPASRAPRPAPATARRPAPAITRVAYGL